MPHRREPRPARPRVQTGDATRPRAAPAPRPGQTRASPRRGGPLPPLPLAPRPSSRPAPNQSGSADRKTKTTGQKRRKLDGAAPAATEPKDTGVDWAPAPPPPNSSPKTWPEAPPSSSTPAKPPPRPASPGALAHQKALRAAADFFSNRGASSSDGDEEGSESEGEQDEAGFITGLFERDAALRGHYERGREDAQFACLACAGGTRNARRFRGCTALVQHAHDATPRYGRPRAHRALAAIICRVLGWDAARLPSIVLDPRGTLEQALTAGATAGVQLAKENSDTEEDTDSSSDEDEEEDVETWIEETSTDDDDEEENELESSEESAEEDGQPDLQNEGDTGTGMEDSSADGDEEENELESREESAEKDFKKGTEDSKNTDKDESADPDNSEKSSEKVNASKGDSFNKGNDGLVHKQAVAKEFSK